MRGLGDADDGARTTRRRQRQAPCAAAAAARRRTCASAGCRRPRARWRCCAAAPRASASAWLPGAPAPPDPMLPHPPCGPGSSLKASCRSIGQIYLRAKAPTHTPQRARQQRSTPRTPPKQDKLYDDHTRTPRSASMDMPYHKSSNPRLATQTLNPCPQTGSAPARPRRRARRRRSRRRARPPGGPAARRSRPPAARRRRGARARSGCEQAPARVCQ